LQCSEFQSVKTSFKKSRKKKSWKNLVLSKQTLTFVLLKTEQIEDMDTLELELEAQKAELAREILGETDVSVRAHQPDRKIGLLDGKVKIVFSDDFEMTTEELIGIR
jgi:hypothetical protein